MFLSQLYENRLNKYYDIDELNRKLTKSPKKTEDRVFGVITALININDKREIEDDLIKLIQNLNEVSFFKDLTFNQTKLNKCQHIFFYAVQKNKAKLLKNLIEARDELTNEETEALLKNGLSELALFYWDKQKINLLSKEFLKFAIQLQLIEIISHIVEVRPGLVDDSICLEYLEYNLEEQAVEYLEVKRLDTIDYKNYSEIMNKAIKADLTKVVNWIIENTNLQDSDFARKREKLFYKSFRNDTDIAELFLPFIDPENLDYEILSQSLEDIADFKSFYNKNKEFLKKVFDPLFNKEPFYKKIFDDYELFAVFISTYNNSDSNIDLDINFCIRALEENGVEECSLYPDLINYFRENIKLEQLDSVFKKSNDKFELLKIIFIKFKESWQDHWYVHLFRNADKSLTALLSMRVIANQDKKRDFFKYLIKISESQLLGKYLEAVDIETAKEKVNREIRDACSKSSWEIIVILLDYQPEMINQIFEDNSTLLFHAVLNNDIRVLKNILSKMDENRFPNLTDVISKAFMDALAYNSYDKALYLIEMEADIKKFVIPKLCETHINVSKKIANNKAHDWLEAILNCNSYSDQVLEQCVLPCIEKGVSINSLLNYKSINIFNKLIESKKPNDVKLTDQALKSLNLCSLFGIPQYSNFEIIIKDGNKQISILVNSSILSNRSGYFSGIFNMNWKESKSTRIEFDMKNYEMSGLTAKAFEYAIKSIYSLNYNISEQNFKLLVKVANFFQIDHLKAELAAWVENSDLNSHYKKHLTPALSKTKLDGQEMPQAKKSKTI